MDEFGVLTQSYGIKPQGKSAPMSSLKKPISASNPNHNSYNDKMFSGSESKNPSSSVFDVNPKNGFFNMSNGYADDDIFGGGFNGLGSKKSNSSHDLAGNFSNFGMEGSLGFVDLMTGSGGTVRSNNVANSKASFPTDWSSSQYEDPFQVLESASNSAGMPLDPLEQLGQLGSSPQGSAFRSSSAGGKNDDLDPFDVFVKPVPVESSLSQTPSAPGRKSIPKLVKIPPPSSSPPPKPVKVPNAVKHSVVTSIDELEKFAMGRAQNNTNKHPEADSTNSGVGASAATTFTATWKSSTKKVEGISKHDTEAGENKSEPGMRYKEASNLSRARSEDDVESFFMGARLNGASRSRAPRNKEAEDASRVNHQSENDLEFFFNMGTRSSSAPRSRAENLENAFDNLFQKGEKPEISRKASSKTSSKHDKASPMINMFDDFSVFGGDELSGDFQEVEGESEERRTARLKRHQRTQNCVAQAVADMNKRELETRREQEEKHRLAEILDGKINQWAWGKEGNLRSLLSSLQNVLWADSGWRPVSLADMITSVSVKKVYNRANLIVHPDKLQQKGASLEQKYIGEKVFDMLKEAWNKFSKEELS